MTTLLPAPLKPWAAQLSQLQRDLALALAPWVQRLSLGIGPLADAESLPTGAPDGLDGVSRKGPYERLLTTEWLYAEVAPEEFLRRAAQAEHLFTRLALREPHQSRQSLALFDTGPTQLGGPRLVHLAALIVFASRCEARGASLSWGVLQAPPRSRQEGFGKNQALTLLKSRTTRDAAEADLEAWLLEHGPAADEVWLVGGPRVMQASAARRLQHLEVHESDAVGRRCVEVQLRRPGRPRLGLTFDLPDASIGAALLRNPFPDEKPARPVGGLRPTSGLAFSASGNRLFTRGPHGELISVTVPYGAPGSVKQVVFQPPPGERVVAAGFSRELLAVTAQADAKGNVLRLVVYPLTKRGERKGPPQRFELPGPTGLPLPNEAFTSLAVLSTGGERRYVLVLLGRAFTLAHGRAIEGRDRVLAHTQFNDRVVHLCVDEQGRRVVRTTHHTNHEERTMLDGLGEVEAFFAAGRRYPLPMLGFGARADVAPWTLVDVSRKSIVFDDLRGGRVMGVTHPTLWPPGLLVRSADGTKLYHFSEKGSTTLVESEHTIVAVTGDFERPRSAWLDASGAIGLFDVETPHRSWLGLPDGHARRLMHFTEVRR
ncbi:MAG: hypothetical protein MUC96_21230 [Myxococcaceae bacterium]|jgi:hypothetical protein|nr:hypothetical protein [Myxococcaceae bacterium]